MEDGALCGDRGDRECVCETVGSGVSGAAAGSGADLGFPVGTRIPESADRVFPAGASGGGAVLSVFCRTGCGRRGELQTSDGDL